MASGRPAPLHVAGALALGTAAGYLGSLLRPRSPEAYASSYAAPHPDAVVLAAGTVPAVEGTPVAGQPERA